MAFYAYGAHHNPSAPSSSHGHHGGRRRSGRLSSQNSHRQFRGVRSMKELTGAPSFNAFIASFEAGRGFELEDDLLFCPDLLTEDDYPSLSSSGSDRSSLSSGSASSSPVQHQAQPVPQVSPPFALAQAFQPAGYPHPAPPAPPVQPAIKIHQPSALRARNAIPIVNPSTGMRVASPPPSSISPARMQQQQQQQAYNAHRW